MDGASHMTGARSKATTDHMVFVGNLAYGVGEQELRTAMSCIGRVSQVQVLRDWNTERHKGCARVHFTSAADRLRALSWEGVWLRGRRARVLE